MKSCPETALRKQAISGVIPSPLRASTWPQQGPLDKFFYNSLLFIGLPA